MRLEIKDHMKIIEIRHSDISIVVLFILCI